MKHEIHYSRSVQAKAMSKSPAQAGIIITDEHFQNRVSLHCINAKDGKQTTHLMLQIPKEDLDNVINSLIQFK